MKKLFLTSVAANAINEIVKRLPKRKLKVAFIPTAADPYKNKWFVNEDMQSLVKAGFSVKNISLSDKKPKELSKELDDIDIVFVAGGNSFYLLEKMHQSGFDKIIKKLLVKGVVYIGSSAGSVVAGPDIGIIKFIDDPSKSKLKSFKGLNLVDFIVLPHWNNKEFVLGYRKMAKDLEKSKHKIIKLTDKQTVFINGKDLKIIET